MLYDLHGQEHAMHALLIDYGQAHGGRELAFAVHHCKRLDIGYTKIGIPQLRGSTLTDGTGGIVVPNRNAIFISLAVNLAHAANADTVTFAANATDEAGFPDCRKAFLDAYNAMLETQGIKVEVCAPYLDKTKAWICALGQEIGVRLTDTWSCYRSGPEPCGVCDACKKRAEAMA